MVDQQKEDRAEIGRYQAIEIARQACASRPEEFALSDVIPGGCHLYGDFSEGQCWFVQAPPPGGRGTQVGGGRMIVVSKQTGRVLYDGSDGGE